MLTLNNKKEVIMYYLNWTVKVHVLGYLAAIKENKEYGNQLKFYHEAYQDKLFIHVHEVVIDYITRMFNGAPVFRERWTRGTWEYYRTKKDGAMIFRKEMTSKNMGDIIIAFQRKKPKVDDSGNIIYEKGVIQFKKRPYFSLYGEREAVVSFLKSLI
jgi:hypothetical protein